MKTVRFAEVVASAGRPEVHLLLARPQDDEILQRAIKANRVMTIHQEVVGNKADYGTTGFEKTAGQILLFPKSIKRFAGRRVVGVNFDLTTDAPGEKRSVDLTAGSPRTPSRKKSHAVARPATPTKFAREKPKAAVISAKRKMQNFTLTAESPDVSALKKKIRRALALIKNGQRVAAYNLLKKSA
jgi:hypothetical protein